MTELLHDFEDGAGPVPARQHANGGGWVANTARVSATAYVGPNAQVSGGAEVSGGARVYENARVYGNARVYENARVYGGALVYGDAWVSGDALVSGGARCSISPLCITGGEYHVTITDRRIQVGCHCHTTDEWAALTPQAAPFLEGIRAHVLAIARAHQARVTAQ